MKTKLLLILLTFTFSMSSYGQRVLSGDHIITDNADGAASVFAADFNGDTFTDVVAASRFDNTIAWYENTDGSGTSWTETIITTDAIGVWSVHAADFDGDTDMDFVAASGGDDTIAWWENDGSGNFTEHEITTTSDLVSQVFAIDISGDTFIDVVTCSIGDNTVSWWENDGSGNFSYHEITADAVGANVIYAKDLDNDGDPDVLSASIDDGKLAWYENLDGLGTFGPQQIITTDPDGAWVVSAADMNGDGFVDVIGNIGISTTAWWENDGLLPPSFTMEHTISESSAAADLFPYDIDYDSDMDVISAEFFTDKIVCFENTDGVGGSFVERLVAEPGWAGPHSVHGANIDDDNYIDIFSAWLESDHIGWHEDILGIDDYELLDFSVYPIPTSRMLYIQSATPIVQIEIYNLMGQLVMSNTDQEEINISSVSQGIYFVKVMDENGDFGTKKVVKK
jgi:hypothetical protein